MKPILLAILSILLFVSCAKDKKEITTKSVVVDSVKKEKPTGISQTNVVVDADGVANVLITSSDIMKFNIRKMTVTAGQKVKLTLTHTGKLDKRVMGHNVVILQKGVKVSEFAKKAAASKENDYIPEGTTEVIAHTKMIGGGETTTIEFTAPETGTYDFICSFPAHFAMMKGKFIVE